MKYLFGMKQQPINDYISMQATNAGVRDINAATHYELPSNNEALPAAAATNTSAVAYAAFPSSASSSSSLAQSPELNWKNQEAWSELVIHVDGTVVPLVASNRRIVIRCTANIYELYRGAASSVVHVIDENFWVTGGKVSPTIDQRGGANRGDPDNSALTGGAATATALLGATAGGSKWCSVAAVLLVSGLLAAVQTGAMGPAVPWT